MSNKQEREITWQELRDLDVANRVKERRVRPIAPGHPRYLEAIDRSVVTVCVGPAGTGKTYMAVAKAVEMLQEGKVERIVLTRPLTSCGRGYGFRPGDPQQKITPTMRPMLDALAELIGGFEVAKLMEEGKIELWALDDMRGANIPRTFIICDEAQNVEGMFQLHMLLTRFSTDSKLVICGDDSPTQIDLVHPGINPLSEVVRRFKHECHKDISIVRLGREDIVRHPLIQWIDERLTTPLDQLGMPAEKNDREAYKLVCPSCKATLWYEDLPDPNGEVEQVRCYGCRNHIDLWTEEGFRPHRSKVKSPKAAVTYPQKP